MVMMIEGKFGIGYRQSPYLFNNFGFKADIADGNSLGGITAKSSYVKFFENYEVPKKKLVLKNRMSTEEIHKRSKERRVKRRKELFELAKRRGFKSFAEYQKSLIQKRGFETEYKYRNDLAKRKGFEGFVDYKNTIAKSKGFKSHSNYQQLKQYERGDCIPMDMNERCSSYLGIYIAEKRFASLILNLIFENVEMMPNNNKGFDATCNKARKGFISKYPQFKLESDKEYKIDVKSSCLYLNPSSVDYWHFDIKGNKMSDYFLCLSFDNRETLNVKYVWLIMSDEIVGIITPYGHKINEHKGFTVSNSERALRKYVEYELMRKLDNINELFDEFKKNKR